jgi:O-antigen/teichoic acid export membrane protein
MLVVSFADRIAFTALLIRAWGVDLFSDWATLLAACGLLMVSESGFQVFLGNALVRAENRQRRRAFNRLVGLGLFFYAVLGAVLISAMVALVVVGNVERLFGLIGMSGASWVFLILAASTILRMVRSGVVQVFRGMGQVHQLMWTEVRAMTAILLASAVSVFAGAGPVTIAGIYLAGELVFGGLWSWRMVRRKFPEVRLGIRLPNGAEFRAMARTLPWYGWLSSATHLMVHIPILIVAWLGLAGAPLAALVVQRTLVNFGKNVSSAASLAVGIEIADLSASSPPEDRERAIRMLARFNVAIAALMLTGLLFFGNAVVGVWTGRADLGSPYILLWLLLPMVLTGPAIPLQMVTFYSSMPRPQALASATQLFLGVALAVLAGSRFGVTGVAFGIGAGEIVGLGIVLPALAASKVGVRYVRIVAECALP